MNPNIALAYHDGQLMVMPLVVVNIKLDGMGSV